MVSGTSGELLCRVARSLGLYGDGISFRVFADTILIQSLSRWRTHHSVKKDASERDSWEVDWTHMVSLETLPLNSSGCSGH